MESIMANNITIRTKAGLSFLLVGNLTLTRTDQVVDLDSLPNDAIIALTDEYEGDRIVVSELEIETLFTAAGKLINANLTGSGPLPIDNDEPIDITTLAKEAKQVEVLARLNDIYDQLNHAYISGYRRDTGSVSISPGLKSISIANVGTNPGYVKGIPLPVGATVDFDGGTGYLDTVYYDATGTTLAVVYVRKFDGVFSEVIT